MSDPSYVEGPALMMAALYTHLQFLSPTHLRTLTHLFAPSLHLPPSHTHKLAQTGKWQIRELVNKRLQSIISLFFLFFTVNPLLSFISISPIPPLQACLATAASLVIGTCPTRTAASPVPATRWVLSASSVSRRGGSASASPGSEVAAVTRVAGGRLV